MRCRQAAVPTSATSMRSRRISEAKSRCSCTMTRCCMGDAGAKVMGIVVLILSLVAQFLFIVQLRVHPPTHPGDQPLTHPSPFAAALRHGP